MERMQNILQEMEHATDKKKEYVEILMEPSADRYAHVTIRTSADGFGETWKAVLDRFFAAASFVMNKMTKINNKTKKGNIPKNSLQ